MSVQAEAAFAHPDIPASVEVELHVHSLDTAVSNLEELASEGTEFSEDARQAMLRLAEALILLAADTDPNAKGTH